MKKITEKNMLDWLEDARLSAAARLAALGDGEEERVQDSPEAREVCIINAIAERVKAMTAVEYLIEMRDILRTYCDNGSLSCGDCPLLVGEKKERCAQDYITKNPHNIVEIVKRWKEEQENAD